jgi:S-adenosylmethionine/arginine decarboxylase-like enzyme
MIDGVSERWPYGLELGDILWTAAIAGGATPLDSRVILLPDLDKSGPESPPGGTAWVGLDESHITLHWYSDNPSPGKTLFCLDVFTCGTNANTFLIADYIMLKLTAREIRKESRDRF